MVGGPIGLGAGGVIGQLVTGQMKPGTAATKLSEALEAEPPIVDEKSQV